MTLQGRRAVVTGRRSDASLYDYGLATYDSGDTFDQSLAHGFIELWGLPAAWHTRATTASMAEGRTGQGSLWEGVSGAAPAAMMPS